MGSTGTKQIQLRTPAVAELQNKSPKPSRKATSIWNDAFIRARTAVQNNEDAYAFSFGRGLGLPTLQNLQQNIDRQQTQLDNNSSIAAGVREQRQRVLNLMQRALRNDYEDYLRNRRGEL